MFISELQLKRLLVLKLLSVNFKESVQHDASIERSDVLFDGGSLMSFRVLAFCQATATHCPKNGTLMFHRHGNLAKPHPMRFYRKVDQLTSSLEDTFLIKTFHQGER